MLMETYYDHKTLMSTNKSKQPMVVKHCKELLTKDDQTTKIIIFEIVKNMIQLMKIIKTTRLHKEVEEKQKGE